MEAILELLFALIEGLVRFVIAAISIVFGLIGFALELLFLAVTQGTSAASKRYEERAKDRNLNQF